MNASRLILARFLQMHETGGRSCLNFGSAEWRP